MGAPHDRTGAKAGDAGRHPASPLRVSATALCGLALIGAGLAWILIPSLPFGGVATGSSLIVSGIVVLILLVCSYRHFRQVNSRLRGDEET